MLSRRRLKRMSAAFLFSVCLRFYYPQEGDLRTYRAPLFHETSGRVHAWLI